MSSDSKQGTLGPSETEGPNEDGVNIKTILAVGVISLTIFALSAVVALVIVRAHNRNADDEGRIANGKYIGAAEIGIVDQPEFENDRRLEKWIAAKQKHLSSYGWVNRERGLIHIPIDKAMEEVIAKSSGAQP